jgi:hypothetical protein
MKNACQLIALACSAPPKGRKRWTLTLLETAVATLNIVDHAGDNTIGRTLKPRLQKQWIILPTANAAFVAGTGDGLEIYQRPHDSDRPVVWLDETAKQLIKETRMPVPATPGRPARHDYEYERNGTANLFMLFAPPDGWRQVEVTDRTPRSTTHRCERNFRTETAPARARSCWSRTISAPASQRRSMKPLRESKHAGWSSSSSTIIRRTTTGGRT